MAVAALTAASSLLGLGRDVVIAAVYGASAELDAYLVAQGLMNLVLAVIAGAMAKSATPQLAREAANETGRCPGHPSFDVALTVTIGVLGVGSVVMALFARPVTWVLAPGFSAEQAALTASLTRWILIATVLIAATNLLAAFGHAHGRFRWAALEGIPFNLTMIVAAVVFGPRYGAYALVAGFVLGSALRSLLQLVPIRALGARLRPSLQVREPGFRQMLTMVPALIASSAVGNVNSLVDRAVASTVSEGAVTALAFGWRFVHLAETLFIAALLVPLYPAIAAVTDDAMQRRRLIWQGVSTALVLTVPLAVGLVVAAPELTATVFGHGAFDRAGVAATATATAWYAPALAALGVRAVLIRASQAVGDARGPLWVSVAAMILNVVGDLTLGLWFGVAGLAAATSIAMIFAAAANAYLLWHRHDALDLAALARSGLTVVATGAAAGLAAWAVRASIVGWPAAVVLVVIGVIVIGGYSGLLFALRLPERHVLLVLLRRAPHR